MSDSVPVGDTRCQRCGSENPVWFAPNSVWNAAVGGPDGVMCPLCFHPAGGVSGVAPEGQENASVETEWSHDGEDGETVADLCTPADAEFIAHAPTDIAALLTRLKTLEAEGARLRYAFDRLARSVPRLHTDRYKGFVGCTDRDPSYCACGTHEDPVCESCNGEILAGQMVTTLTRAVFPLLPADHSEQDWEFHHAHAECLACVTEVPS